MTFNISTGQTLQSSGPPNGNPPTNFSLESSSFFPLDNTINWNNPVPPDNIANSTLNQILQNNSFTKKIEITPSIIMINGQQGYDSFNNNPISYFTLFYSNFSNGSPKFSNSNIRLPTTIGSGLANYTGSKATFPSFNPDELYNSPNNAIFVGINIYNDCSNVPLCIAFSAINYTSNLVLNVQMSIDCSGANTQSDFCTNFCNNTDNLQTCFPNYAQYCLSILPGATGPVITTSLPCQNFITQYIAKVGTSLQIDDALLSYCSNKFTSLNDLFNANQIDKDLCGCHMPESLYDEFQKEVVAKFPGFGLVSTPAPCLFPYCINSLYKSERTGKVCPIPQCINIVSIDSSGNPVININQSAQCANIAGGTGITGSTGSNPNNTSNKSWWDKYWIWVVLGIAVAVILIIVILIIVASDSNKKKGKNIILKKDTLDSNLLDNEPIGIEGYGAFPENQDV